MTNLEVIEGLYRNFSAGNVAGVVDAMHEAVVWNEAENFPYADRNPYVGPQAVVEGVFMRCLGDYDDFAVTISNLYDAGEHIIASGRYSGVNKATGKTMNPQLVHIWTLADGKIVKFQQHVDTLAVHHAAR